MYKKGAGNDKQGKDAGNRTLCPYRNFSQAIKISIHSGEEKAKCILFVPNDALKAKMILILDMET